MTIGSDVAWTQMINPMLDSLEPGFLALKQNPEAIHLNHNGDMNAGVLCSMVEMAGLGVVVTLLGDQADKAFVVVKDLSVKFIARARGEITFSATMSVEQQQRALESIETGHKVEEFIQVQARDAGGKIVAQGSITSFISPQK